MYIKQKKTPLKNGDNTITFNLVESKRGESHGPQQRQIAYLGSLRESSTQHQQETFLREARERLDACGSVNSDDIVKLIKSLKQKLPQPRQMGIGELITWEHNQRNK